MAVQYTTYNTDGTTRTFPSTKHIATIQHVGVYLKRVVDNVWVVVNVNDYALVQNSIIFDTAPDSALYAQVEVRVADDAAEITTSPSDIALVAGSIVNVDTVATNIGAVNTTATNIGAVTTTSGSIANVNTVAANIVNVNLTAGNTANINAVVANAANVTAVGLDLLEPESEINTVALSIANVNTVGSAIVNVNTVATNMANVNSVATTIVPNIAEILLADNNATIATTQAGIATTQAGLATDSATEAEHWASYTTDVAVPEGTGEFSAKHYATKAAASAASVNDTNLMHLTGDETALGVKSFSAGIKVAGANVTAYGKNYLINGGFDYWNYATSQTTSGYGSDDRWSNNHVGSTKTHSQVASTDTERALFNSSKFSRTVVVSVVGAGNATNKEQGVENVAKLAGKTVTISFWAKADATKNIAIELVQNFGTGGTPSAEVTSIGSQLVALTSIWQKKSITVTLPSIVGKTLGTDGVHTSKTVLRLWFDAGSNFATQAASLGQQSGTFDIAEVKLEEGIVSTPWTPYEGEFGGEVQACQRYYEVSSATSSALFSGNVTSGSLYYYHYTFKSTKRVPATIITTNIDALSFPTTASSIAGSVNVYGVRLTRTASTSAMGYFSDSITASAEL